MKTTIALIRGAGWMGSEDYVSKVFRDEQSAHAYANKHCRNLRIRVLEGKWRVRQEIPIGTKSTAL